MTGTVIVSGASTGIGRATAQHLSGLGFDVLAGVRREGDAPGGTTPVLLDVTDAAAVDALAQRMGGAPLAGLVNNAGVALGGPIEHLGVDGWRRQFDVNLFGHIAVSRALLPALRAGRGRIVNVGSIGGRMALPFVAPYTASKFALRAFSDSLRLEVRAQGIHVALLEPGSIATPIWDKGQATQQEVEDELAPELRERYAKGLEGARKQTARAARDAIAPEKVAAVVEQALTGRRPRAHYVIGREAKAQALLAHLPAPVTDRLLRLAFGI